MFKSLVAKQMKEWTSEDGKKESMTLREMEKRSGLSHVTILRARDDQGIRSCSLDTLGKLAQALGCRVKDLFEEE